MSLSSINCFNSIKYQPFVIYRIFWSSLVIVINIFTISKVIAAPENFNPKLESLPVTETDGKAEVQSNEEEKIRTESSPQVIPQPAVSTQASPTLSSESAIESGTADIELKNQPDSTTNPSSSKLTVDNLTVDFQQYSDNFGQTNQLIEESIAFNLYNQSFVLKTGINSFKQSEIETVGNIPLYLAWETKLKNIDLTLTSGMDFFNRLSARPTLSLQASSPLFSNVTADGKLKSLFVLSGQAQYRAYKFNAKTLENEINFWRFTPSIYWQIRPNFTFFSLGQYGTFSDSNQEFQSFSRLEKKLSSFYLAANLFTWSFEQDLDDRSGYFSPLDFLVYNAEIGWQGKMFNEFLNCQLAAAFGEQRLDSETDSAWTYKASCGAQLLSNVKLDLGYTYSNVRDRRTGNSNYNNQSFTGQLQIDL